MMTETSEIRNTVRHFIVSNYLPGEALENLKDDTPLRTSGILDSMSTLALVSFVEERFGVTLEAHETGIEHFDRVEDIAALVERKQKSGV
jgi:acyl carrier protein